MITYLEGLPRSGKSLNCLKDFVVPALAKSRKAFAYVAGLNHEQIARLAGITLEQCEDLLIVLTKEQAREFHKHVEPDALVVLDEAESMWPARRQPLEEEQRTYIAEHGHYGLDIVLMGQTFNELHTTWRSRTEQKNFYLKRTAAGKPDEFSVTIYRAIHDGNKVKWQELRHIKGQQYDTEYFGAYKSHEDGTENKETFIDERANVWNNPILKKWMPTALVVGVLSLGYTIYLFSGGLVPDAEKPVQAQVRTPPPPPAPAPPPPAPIKTTFTPSVGAAPQQLTPVFHDPAAMPEDPPDLIDHLSTTGRVRLSGYARMGNRTAGFIEWRSETYQLLERMSFDNLQAMGWMVLVNDDASLAIVQKYHRRYIATAWPLPDSPVTVPQATQEVLAADTQ